MGKPLHILQCTGAARAAVLHAKDSATSLNKSTIEMLAGIEFYHERVKKGGFNITGMVEILE